MDQDVPKDLGHYGIYAFVKPDKKPRVIFLYYLQHPRTKKYRLGIFDNFVDGLSEFMDKQSMRQKLEPYFKQYEMHNGDRTGEELHAIFKHQVSKFYTQKWFSKNVYIIGNDIIRTWPSLFKDQISSAQMKEMNERPRGYTLVM